MLPLLGILFSFILVIVLLTRQYNLGVAMLTGSFVVGLTSTTNISNNLKSFFPTFLTSVTNPIALEIITLVTLVAVFGYLMKELDVLSELIAVARHYFNDIFLIITAIPSVIGVLPMPGGAVFSAPIIEPIGKEIRMSRGRLTSLNIYYRHLWYFVFPYMPSLMIASSLSGIDVLTISLMHLPIVFLMIIVGWLYYGEKGKVKNRRKETYKELNNKITTEVNFKLAIQVILPFLIVLLPPLIFNISFVYALLLGILYLITQKKDKFKKEYLLQGINLNLTLGVTGIMVFKGFVENSEGVHILTEILVGLGIPLILLSITIPFLAGLLTGNHTGAIGISYPIILSMFTDSQEFLLWHMLIFSSSYFGYVLSPFHLCNLMTIKYFGISLDVYYQEIYKPFLVTAVGILALTGIYYFTII